MTPPYLKRRSLLIAGAAATVAGCATSAKEQEPNQGSLDAPLEVVVFKGAYGDDYAQHAAKLYKEKHPKSTVDAKGIQKVGEVLQPRFMAGSPPDVVDNSGAGRLDLATLVAGGSLLDLKDLLNSPSWDDPKKTVRETLLPGVVDEGTFDGKVQILNYSSVLWGIWYSKSLFAKHSWAYPQNWDEMLTLCGEIKKAGIAPWTWQGKYPEYMNDPLVSLAAKAGGTELIKAIDNLEAGAWKRPEMLAAAEAIYQLAVRGYIMSGSEALSHTEAQNAWCKGQAAFIPCGSWLEGEQKDVTPAGFDMTMGTVPALSASDKLPGGAVMAASSESFFVPAKAKNPQGGLEYLRILFSKDVARGFAEKAKSLPVVLGAADGLTLPSGLTSVVKAAATKDLFIYKFRTWYAPLSKAVDDATGELLTKRLNPAQWADRVQKAADAVKADASIKKHQR